MQVYPVPGCVDSNHAPFRDSDVLKLIHTFMQDHVLEKGENMTFNDFLDAYSHDDFESNSPVTSAVSYAAKLLFKRYCNGGTDTYAFLTSSFSPFFSPLPHSTALHINTLMFTFCRKIILPEGSAFELFDTFVKTCHVRAAQYTAANDHAHASAYNKAPYSALTIAAALTVFRHAIHETCHLCAF